jgi:hypothetical protein
MLATCLFVVATAFAQTTPDGLRLEEKTKASIEAKRVTLPVWDERMIGDDPSQKPNADRFEFVSDGPKGSGWGRPDEVPRVYLERRLPAFFSRTLLLDSALPDGAKLNWIFTGLQGGFTVELTSSSVHVFQRFYDSFGLREEGSKSNYPVKLTDEITIPYSGIARAVTVELDSKLMLRVKVNSITVSEQSCLLDVTRDQLQFTGLRTTHRLIAGTVRSAPSETTSIQINSSKHFQSMLGFGGSPSIPAYESLSEEGKKLYWKTLQKYNLLIDREYPMGTRLKPDMSNLDTLADASPHYYGDNFPNGEVSSFTYNAMSIKVGGKVIYEMWALPTWATKDFTDSEGKLHKGAANVDEWARAMLTYTRMEKQRTGKAPDILGIENEVTQPKEITYEMVETLRRELDKAGFQSVRIHMPDASLTSGGVTAAKMLSSDPDVWSKIDYAASHEYDYQKDLHDPDAFDVRLTELRAADGDKPFLSTELCLNSPLFQIASYRAAFQMGQLYHKNLTILDSIGILYCWLILDTEEPNFPASRALLVPDRIHGFVPIASSFQLRVLGAFSRRIREGMVRIDARSSNPDVLVSAYENSKGNKTIVVLNRSMQPQTLEIRGSSGSDMEVERVSLYEENSVARAPDHLTIQPGEILTVSKIPQPGVTPAK